MLLHLRTNTQNCKLYFRISFPNEFHKVFKLSISKCESIGKSLCPFQLKNIRNFVHMDHMQSESHSTFRLKLNMCLCMCILYRNFCQFQLAIQFSHRNSFNDLRQWFYDAFAVFCFVLFCSTFPFSFYIIVSNIFVSLLLSCSILLCVYV